MLDNLTPMSYSQAARERVLIFDGAFGTHIQTQDLQATDFGGTDLEGCNENLVITRPDVIQSMHEQFLSAGVDVIETATFGAFSVPLSEYGIEDRVHEINFKSAQIAREVVTGFDIDRPRWVAGSIGPGTRFASLGQIGYYDLRNAYEAQARGLLEGGVDLLIIETVFDLLGAKAAINGCRQAMQTIDRQVPLQVQVTIEVTGRMLPGTEMSAAIGALLPLGPDVLGINCATGPAEMSEHLRVLSEQSTVPIACIPNAGMPSVIDGEMHYHLTPSDLADYMERYITELGVSVIGGCCGTTIEHIKALVERCHELTPANRAPKMEPGATSIYSHVPFDQDSSFLIIGERTNANGSKKFREALLDEDLDTCLQVARDQVAAGAHVLDLCVDYVGRDGVADMSAVASRFSTQVAAPIMLDSTEPNVLKAGLAHIGGRAILNSANLEDGAGDGSRIDQVLKLAREYGAAVICLLIDEDGQARDVDWKMKVAQRIYEIAVNGYGLSPSDLIFDALTFPLTTGDENLRRDGIATIEAIKRIKIELPGAFTTLGISNVSFGIKPAARHALNSVFLHECLEAGLDSAIVNPAHIMPLHHIPDQHAQICRDLIWDRRRSEGQQMSEHAYDPLQELLTVFEDVETVITEREDRSDWKLEKRLKHRIIDGDKDGLTEDLDLALRQGATPLVIINDTLLTGMRSVGEMFASGEMQLPFVLQSAETMKAAVAHLEPHMDKVDTDVGKGSIVLATVKGDVHDIGKNLVDIILTNNGYIVHNLGIKVSISEMVNKLINTGANALGMSGLLVKSTLIMRDNLKELNDRGMSDIPVLLGGAALTRTHVEKDLREVYKGRLFYGKDAFEGLRVMDRLMELNRTGEDDPDFGVVTTGRDLPVRSYAAPADPKTIPVRSPDVVINNEVPATPFLGSRLVKGISLDEIAEYINETALFRNQWQFRPEGGEKDEDFKTRIRPTLRDQLSQAKAETLLLPQIAYGYFPANSDGNDVIIWTDETRSKEQTRFSYPRQTIEPWLCIADFFRSVESLERDYAAFQIVTMGRTISERTAELFAANRYQDYLLLHGIGVEMAEALAELCHYRIRREWGFDDQDDPSLTGLFRQQYRGGRYSWGYPACPNLEDNAKVLELLKGARIGLKCNEETGFQYQPEQTTSALICHHPQAKYFVAK